MMCVKAQITRSERIQYPKSGLPALRALFLLLCAGALLVSCGPGPYQPVSYSGRLLLFYPGDEKPGTTKFGAGVYELKQGQESPQLLLDLPEGLGGDQPIISPDGSLTLFKGFVNIEGNFDQVSYMVNLQTGESHLFYPAYLHGAVISPDNRHLAYTDENRLIIISLHDIDLDEMDRLMKDGSHEAAAMIRENSSTLMSGKCTTGSNCSACLPVDYPVWVDNETLVVATDAKNTDPNYEASAGALCGTNGLSDMFAVVHLDGSPATFVPASIMSFPLEYTNPNLAAVAIILDEWDKVNQKDELFWVDANAVAQSGDATRYSLGTTADNSFSIAPDSRTMLRYNDQWELMDMKSGEVTVLQKDPSTYGISRCVWSPEGKSVACIGVVNAKNQLFLVPLTGEKPMMVYNWVITSVLENWFLLSWLP
jgi:hypothetical protein